MKPFYAAIPLIILLVTASGCGVYSFKAGGKAAFESLNVTQFENNTIEYQLADRLTDAVIDAFIMDNTVQIKEPARADAIMKGTVVSYRREAYTFDQEDNVSEYAVKVALSIKVLKADSEEIIWTKDFYAEGVYDANLETEEEGQDRIVTLLTGDILSHTTKSW